MTIEKISFGHKVTTILFLVLISTLFFSQISHAATKLPEDDSLYISFQDGMGPYPYQVEPGKITYPDRDQSTQSLFKVYSYGRNNVTVNLSFVNRDYPPDVACNNYSIRFRTLTLLGSETGISGSGQEGTRAVNGCGSSPSFTIPASDFTRSTVEEHQNSNIYIAALRIYVIKNASTDVVSPTFHLRSLGGNIGFLGGYSDAVSIYSTNEKNNQTIDFNFKPPCSLGTSSGEPYSVSWSGANDSNQALNSYHRGDSITGGPPGTLRVILLRNGSPLKSQTNPPDNGSFDFNHVNKAEYTLRFTNVTGGNRIKVNYPFDSGDFGSVCPDPVPQTPRLSNSSYVDRPAVQYNPPAEPTTDRSSSGNVFTVANGGTTPLPPSYSMGIDCGSQGYGPINTYRCNQWNNYYKDRVDKAQEAFAQASFIHRVGNEGNVSAASGTHNSRIQYRFVRANNPSTGQNGERDTYADRFGGNTWTGNLAQGGPWSDIRPAGWSPNPTTSAHTSTAASLINGDTNGYGRPWYGDMYCERAVTDPGNIRTYDGSNYEYCVTLFQGPPPPPCSQAWQLHTDGYLQQQYGSGWIEGFGRTVPDAWVGSRFKFTYSAYKTGPASSTDPIESNVGGMNGQRISNSDPFNPFVVDNGEYSIGPELGGQTIRQQPYFQYTSNDPARDPCQQGRDEFEMNVVVPYYYHLAPNNTTNTEALIQQGDSIGISGNVREPQSDNDPALPPGDNESGAGRQHTYTESDREHEWRYISFKTSAMSAADIYSTFGSSARDGGVPCSDSFGIIGFTDCHTDSIRDNTCTSPISGGSHRFTVDTLNLPNGRYCSDLSMYDPVGTVICITLAIQKPTQSASWNTWRYGSLKCSTVAKSPKVQFRGGDVTTGRYLEGEGGIPCSTPNTSARIETTAAPGGNSYQYGSWGEYGVFSSGNVFSFGSSGAQAGNTAPAKRLTFGNTGTNLGSYAYGNKCLVNHIAKFKPDSGPALPTTVYPNEYFTDASTVGKKYFEREGNVSLETRPSDTYKAIVTLVGYSDYGEDVQEGPMKPADASVRVFLKNGQSFNATASLDSNNPSAPATKTVDFNLGINGWRGIDRVTVNFANNNGESPGWSNPDPNKRPMSDRNMYLKSVRVQWQKNGTTIVADTQTTAAGSDEMRRKTDDNSNISDPNIRCNKIDSSTPTSTSWQIANRFSDGRIAFAIDENEASSDSRGYCIGVYFDSNNLNAKDGRFNDSFPPPPLLNNQYDGFNGRDMVIHAKRSGNTCNGTSGNIYINLDIDYKNDGYTSLSQVPRFTLLADCKIIISNNVRQVRASLVAGDAIQTCSGVAKNTSTCNIPLTITGVIQSKRLLLWRTSGADLTDDAAAKVPAETFIYSTDQMLSSYIYGQGESTLRPVYQTDLAPRY